MKCPRQHTTWESTNGDWSHELGDCLKEECAWWDGHGGFCSILKINRHLEGIAKALGDIADKMPKSTQFGR